MIYHIYANQSNIGDWLSAKGIQKLIGSSNVTECFCDTPFVEETIAKLAAATEKDLIIIGGGGLLMDYFIPFWTAFRRYSETIPFCVWGIGYCDLKTAESRPPSALIEDILVSSRFTSVRDQITRHHLSVLNLPNPVQCPSINIIKKLPVPGKDFLHAVNFSTAGEEVYNSMCARGKSWAQGHDLVYRETNNIIQKGHAAQLEKVLSLYEMSGVVLSSALHGCIIAATMGLKLVTVSGDRKIEGFMEAVGLSDYVLDLDETDQIDMLLTKALGQIDPSVKINHIREENEKIAKQVISIYTNL